MTDEGQTYKPEDLDYLVIDLDSAEELSTLPTGTEATLQINEVFPDPARFNIRIRCSILGAELTKDITHFLYFPKRPRDGQPGDDPKKTNNKILMIRNFCKAVGIASGDWSFYASNPRSLIGLTFNAILKETSSSQYGKQNEVDRLQLPSA